MIIVNTAKELSAELSRREGSVGYTSMQNTTLHKGHRKIVERLCEVSDTAVVNFNIRHLERKGALDNWDNYVKELTPMGVDIIWILDWVEIDRAGRPALKARADDIMLCEGYAEYLKHTYDIEKMHRTIMFHCGTIDVLGVKVTKRVESTKDGHLRCMLKHFFNKYFNVEIIQIPVLRNSQGGIIDARAERNLSEDGMKIYNNICKEIFSNSKINLSRYSDNIEYEEYIESPFLEGRKMFHCLTKIEKFKFHINRTI